MRGCEEGLDHNDFLRWHVSDAKDSAKVLIDVMMAQFFDANLLCGPLEVVHGRGVCSGQNGPNGRTQRT